MYVTAWRSLPPTTNMTVYVYMYVTAWRSLPPTTNMTVYVYMYVTAWRSLPPTTNMTVYVNMYVELNTHRRKTYIELLYNHIQQCLMGDIDHNTQLV